MGHLVISVQQKAFHLARGDLAAHAGVGVPTDARPKLDGFGNIKSIIIFGGLLAAALLYVA